MKLVAFAAPRSGQPRPGALLEASDEILDFAAAPLPAPASFLEWLDLDARYLAGARALLQRIHQEEGLLERLREEGAVRPRGGLRLLAPVPRPGKVLCIGLNYRDHAAESGMPIPDRPLLFSKLPSSVIGPGEAVRIPKGSSQVDYEAELAVVIGRRARAVPEERAASHVLGYANFNDVSARDFQFEDGQWQRGKSCDTFAPLGPFVVTPDELPDPHDLAIRLRLDGRTLQDSRTSQLIFGVPQLIASISESITLEPGDVIATGTPPGVGFARKPPIYLQPGNIVEVEIEGLGILANPVAGPAGRSAP